MNTEMHRQAEPGWTSRVCLVQVVSAPAFVHLVEEETAAFGRYQAQAMPAAAR
jgi:hypothetical protein